MMNLIPTLSLAVKMGIEPIFGNFKPNTILGDWYTTDVLYRKELLILAISYVTRFGLILRVEDFKRVPEILGYNLHPETIELTIPAEASKKDATKRKCFGFPEK